MPRPTDQAIEDRIVDLTCEGWTAAQIAQETGVTARTVTRIRRRCGVAGPVYPRLSDEELELAERMLADGASIVDVARTLGRSEDAMRKRFRGRGWSNAQVAEYRAMLRKLKQLELSS